MTQKDRIKNLEKENTLLREQIELKDKLETSKPQIIHSDSPITFAPLPKEPKLEVGKWLKPNHGKAIINYQGGGSGYGLNKDGDWEECNNWSFNSWPEDWQPATDKEVEESLIKEAKKRGFKDYIFIKPLFSNGDPFTSGLKWETDSISSFIFVSGELSIKCNNRSDTCRIFANGKWAEIIEESVPTINGYEMEIDDDEVKFGCEKYNIDMVRELWCISDRIGLESFTIDSNFVKIMELKEIVDYLNK